MLFLRVIIIAFAHKKKYRKMLKSVHILLKMVKSIMIKYNISIVFTYLDRP